MERFSLYCILLCLHSAWAQNPAGWASFAGDSSLCNRQFSDANGTGIFHFDPNIAQGADGGIRNATTGKALPIGAAITLTTAEVESKTMEYSLWYSPNGANYSNDLALGYDVCGFGIGPLPGSVNARGQTDNGSCYDLLDQTCVNDIESLAQDTALQLTLVIEQNSNLSSNSLPGVCQSITNTINANLPKSCSPYFTNQTKIVQSAPLTKYNSTSYSVLNDTCTLDEGYSRYSLITTVYGVDNSNTTYDALAQVVLPVLLVWMPVANVQRTQFLTSSKAGMVCGRIDNFSQGSRIPPPLAQTFNSTGGSNNSTDTDTDDSAEDGLSGGAIGGIVVGIVLALAILGLLIWFAMRRKKSKRSNVHEVGARDSGERRILDKETGVVSEMDVLGPGRTELSSGTHYFEADGYRLPPTEVSGTEVHRYELPATRWDQKRRSGMPHEVEG